MKPLIPLLALAAIASADTPRSAKVTHAINDVAVYPPSATSYPAAVGESVSAPSSVQTGRKSRAELTFGDRTITRLGQNSVFAFRSGGRDVELKQGSVLLQVPKNAGGATIRTATVTAAITGTTSMFEYSPGKWIKLLTLEGTQHLSLNGGKESVAVPAGKMLIMHPDAKLIPEPVDIDIDTLVKTSPLAGDKLFGPLPDAAREAIAMTIAAQDEAKRQGNLLPTRDIISGPGVRQQRRLRDANVANTLEPVIEPMVPSSSPPPRDPDGEFPTNQDS